MWHIGAVRSVYSMTISDSECRMAPISFSCIVFRSELPFSQILNWIRDVWPANVKMLD